MSSNDKRVTVVVQRCDKASLLLDNVDVWAHVGWGLVVYVSFAKGATDAAVSTAARKILHAPILTRGVWGDDNRPQSVAQFCRQHQEQHTGEALGGGGGGGGGGDVPTDEPIAEIPDASDGPDSIATLARQTAVVPNILVIPQAALTNKYTGKSIQYRNQSTRADGKRLFELFLAQLQEPLLVYVATIPSMLLRPVHLVNQALNQDADTTVQYMYSNFCWCRYPDDPALQKAKSRHNMGAFHKRKAGRDSDVHLLPSDYFREGTEFRDKFSSFDDKGFPLLLADGAALSKNARKKLLKALAAHEKRHAQYLVSRAAKDTEAAAAAAGATEVVPPPAKPTNSTETACNNGGGTTSGGERGHGAVDLLMTPAPTVATTRTTTTNTHAMPRVVGGTFGNRQALRLESDMGPFTHAFSF